MRDTDGMEFRERVQDAAARVAERTGVDPLDVRAAMAVATDARLELLPQSVGIGAGLMAAGVFAVCARFLADPGGGPGFVVTAMLVVVAILLALSCAACVLIARAARGRRPERHRYEDAWARLAVELWPAPRLQQWSAASVPVYSRTEFLMAVRGGGGLDRFARHAPVTRMA